MKLSNDARSTWAVATVVASILAFCAAPAAWAQGQVPQRVPGRYIVVLKDTAGDPGQVAAQMAKAHGLVPEHVYGVALKGFSATIPEARVAAVRNDARVKYVEQDQIVEAFGQTLPTGVNRVDADECPTASNTSTSNTHHLDVDIAIIDTGIDLSHPDLYVVGGQNCIGGNPRAYDDGNGHGTHVAGTAAALDNSEGVVGVAPGARLWAV